MKNYTFLESVEENFYRRIIFCLQKVFDQDLLRYLDEFRMRKTSAVPNFIWDAFWDNLESHMEMKNVRVEEFTRNAWSGDMIIDDDHKFVITVMRENRLAQLKKSKRRTLHYLETFVGVLNREFEAPEHQITLGDLGLYSEEDLIEDFDKLCKGRINVGEGYHHCLLVFQTVKNQLLDARLCILDKHLELCKEVPLNKYIKPDYASILFKEQIEPNKAIGENDPSIPVPYKEESSASLVKLKNI